MSEFSDTKTTSAHTVQSTSHAVICLFHTGIFNPNQIFTLLSAEQISSYICIPSECKHLVASSDPSGNIFCNVYLASPAFHLFPLPCSFKLFPSSFQTLPCLLKLVVVEKGSRHIRLLKNFSCLFLLFRYSLANLASRRSFVGVVLLCSSWMYFLMGLSKAINLFELCLWFMGNFRENVWKLYKLL